MSGPPEETLVENGGSSIEGGSLPLGSLDVSGEGGGLGAGGATPSEGKGGVGSGARDVA